MNRPRFVAANAGVFLMVKDPVEVIVIYWARIFAARKEARYANDSNYSRYAAVDMDHRCFFVGVGGCSGGPGRDRSIHSADWIGEPGAR